jgi:alkaline phosphatase
VGEEGTLTMDTLPETAFVKTFSNDATDSAPSMAAYMTGVKMNNEVISMSANTVAIDPARTRTTTSWSTNAAPATARPPPPCWNWPRPRASLPASSARRA